MGFHHVGDQLVAVKAFGKQPGRPLTVGAPAMAAIFFRKPVKDLFRSDGKGLHGHALVFALVLQRLPALGAGIQVGKNLYHAPG